MRAPVLVFPRTRAPSQGRGYLDAGAAGTPDAFGAGIAKGAAAVGSGLVDLATVFQHRDDQTSRFKALSDLTKFETSAAVEQEELKRTAPVDGTDFVETSLTAFDKSSAKFMEPIKDPVLRAEVQGKMDEIKQRRTLDSYHFKFEQQDAFYKAGTNELVETWRNRVYADKGLLDQARKEVITAINATGLKPEEKVQMTILARQDLEAAAFGSGAMEISRKAQTSGPPPEYAEGARSITGKLVARSKVVTGVQLDAEHAAVVAGNMQQESGFRTWAHNPDDLGKPTWGLIQWRAERGDAMRAAAATAGKDWRDPNFQVDFFLKEFKNDYPEAWGRFITATSMTAMNAALKEYIAYKDEGGSNSATRLKNAEAILVGADPQADLTKRDDTLKADLEALNKDPQYMAVPLEKRLAALAAADAQATEEANETAKAAKEAVDAKLNNLFVGLHDGTQDETDVKQARDEGWLSQIEDLNTVDQILGNRNAGLAETQMVQSTLDNDGQGYNRVTMNGEKNKGVNAWVGDEGLAKISARDDAYMDQRLLPAVRTWDDIPTNVVGQLESMSASNDTAAAVWALERLQQMKDIAPNGFVARTSENRLGERVEAFRNLRGLFETNEEMLSYVNGGTTPEAQRVMVARDKQARTDLNKLSSKTFLNKIVPSWWGTYASQDYEVAGAYEAAGRELYVLNYRMTGNETQALRMTAKTLEERWGKSSIADSTATVAMEWPPEKVYAGTKVPMDVYQDQIRRDFNLTSDENYRLIADDTTYREIGLAGRGQLAGPDGKPRLPSYKVRRISKNGNVTEEGRWFGDPVVPAEETE